MNAKQAVYDRIIAKRNERKHRNSARLEALGRERLNALYRQACVEGKPTIRAAK